jgi:hypothetical protein
MMSDYLFSAKSNLHWYRLHVRVILQVEYLGATEDIDPIGPKTGWFLASDIRAA